jgi:hypothetical protein
MTNTLILLHNQDEIIEGIAGCRVGSHNYFRFPKKRLTIIHFDYIFDPYNNRGYYIDIYIKRLIKKWKNKRLENIQRRKDRSVAKELYYKLDFYLVNYIINFI